MHSTPDRPLYNFLAVPRDENAVKESVEDTSPVSAIAGIMFFGSHLPFRDPSGIIIVVV